MEQSTALAVSNQQDAASLQLAAAREELQRIRDVGVAAVERQRSLNNIARALEGCQWGDVKGTQLSIQTRYMIARVCDLYQADPYLHIYILGGRIYRNADYWTEKVNGLPNLVDWYQINISKSYSDELRTQSKARLEEAKQFDSPELKADALDLLRKANAADERRAFFGIPADAIAAYETVIILADRAEPVREANYAPHAGDAVGKQRPHETARTRSLRRAAVKASPDLRVREERGAREALEGEFEIIQEDKAVRGALSAGAAQAVDTGHGEPAAAIAAGAKPLPVEGEPAEAAHHPGGDPQAASPVLNEQGSERSASSDTSAGDPDVRKDLSARFFASLRDAGYKGDQRQEWCRQNGLKESTQEWTEDDFRRAIELLVAPFRDNVLTRCMAASIDIVEFSRGVLELDQPDYLRHWKALRETLDARGVPDATAQGGTAGEPDDKL